MTGHTHHSSVYLLFSGVRLSNAFVQFQFRRLRGFNVSEGDIQLSQARRNWPV